MILTRQTLLLNLAAGVIVTMTGTQSGCAQTPDPVDLSHGLRRLKELQMVVPKAAPSAAARKLIDAEIQSSVKQSLAPAAEDPRLPGSARSAMKELATKKNIPALSQAMEDVTDENHVKPDLVPAGYSVRDSIMRLQQVLTTHVPAFSLAVTTPGTGGTAISACQGGGDFYPDISQTMMQHAAQVRALGDSVGRVERKAPGQQPEVIGTAFVVDRQARLAATACHVVDALADYHPDTKTWVLKGPPGGAAVAVLLDFGAGDTHNPTSEYRIEGVAFVPSVEGCDGALLKLAVTAASLPPDLPLAVAEPTVPATTLDAFSIGYPGTPGPLDTAKTAAYFNCIRAAAPGAAKFAFGGPVTGDRPMRSYHLLTHMVPTIGGQSGSPVFDASDPSHPKVVGIHICCQQDAISPYGLSCERRNEPYLQEAVSVVDLLNLYRQQLVWNRRPGPATTVARSALIGTKPMAHRAAKEIDWGPGDGRRQYFDSR